jgi:hypothetical protein
MSGKASEKSSKYCKIMFWLKEKDKDLADAFEKMCMDDSLIPRRSDYGITFIYPDDKDYRKKIIRMANGEDEEMAIKIMGSLILVQPIHAGRDFERFKESMVSTIGLKIDYVSSDDTSAKFEGGIELEKVEFTPLHHNNFDVWKIVKGEMPIDGEIVERPRRKIQPRNVPLVEGGDDDPPVVSHYHYTMARAQIATAVEANFLNLYMNGKHELYNPYIAKVISLLHFLSSKHREVFMTVVPIIDLDPFVTFYLLLEPYKTVGEYLIPNEVLFNPSDPWTQIDTHENAVHDYMAFFNTIDHLVEEKHFSDGIVPGMFSHPEEVLRDIEEVRNSITGDSDRLNGVRMLKDIKIAYEILEKRNQINGKGPVLPQRTIRLLSPYKKLWQDEFRFIISNAFTSLLSLARPDAIELSDIYVVIRFQKRGNNYEDELFLSKREQYIQSKDRQYLVVKFVNSSYFFYFPNSEKNIGEKDGEMFDPKDFRRTNLNLTNFQSLQRYSGMVTTPKVPEALPQEVQPQTVQPQTVQ